MILQTNLTVGAEQPFSLVHLSDTHLAFPDVPEAEKPVQPHDPAALTPVERLAQGVAAAKQYGARLVHTGDLTDYVSAANLAYVRQFVAETECFVAAGNHDFRLYRDHAFEDAAYRARSEAMVQQAFANNIRMDSKIINGVNLIALDDSYYQIDAQQAAFLEKEVQKGLPIILLVHAPIYESELFDTLMYHRERVRLPQLAEPCTYLIGVPPEKMTDYAPNRVIQQRSDAATMEILAWIRSEPMFRAVLTGHVHCNCESRLRPDLPQLIISRNDLRVLHVR